MWQPREELAQPRRRVEDRFVEPRMRDGRPRGSSVVEGDGVYAVSRIDDGRRSDLGEVVVLGLQPEHRDHRAAGLRFEALGPDHSGGGLPEGIERPAKQADLLAGDDDAHAVRVQLGEPALSAVVRRPNRGVLLHERSAHCGVQRARAGAFDRSFATGRRAKRIREQRTRALRNGRCGVGRSEAFTHRVGQSASASCAWGRKKFVNVSSPSPSAIAVSTEARASRCRPSSC